MLRNKNKNYNVSVCSQRSHKGHTVFSFETRCISDFKHINTPVTLLFV